MELVRKLVSPVSPLVEAAPVADREVDDSNARSALAARFQAGDHAAVQELVDVYGGRLLAFLSAMVRSRDLAEDLLQDVLACAYSKRSQLARPDRLESWLFALARNAALRELARPRYRAEVAVEQEEIEACAGADPARPASHRVQHDQAAALLLDALSTLDDRRRELVALRYYSDLGLKEIAEVLQMPLGSVGTTLVRTLEVLRRHFASRGLSAEDLLP